MITYFKELEDSNNQYLEIPGNYKYKLPNTWFITPFNHLYNSLGQNAHKEANLIYSLNDIIYNDNMINYRKYLKMIKENEYKNIKMKNFMIGFYSASAGLYKFFEYLRKNSSDYYSDLEYLKTMNIDEILVKCCGFHKISSVAPKTIITSCINYEKEFEEYIKKNWEINFEIPIILNLETNRLEEYDEDFILVKKMHRSY